MTTPAPSWSQILSSVAQGKCPECHAGKISKGFFGMERRCPHCGYDLNPENGYFLGAMMIAFFVTSLLTVPPLIVMKFMGVEDRVLFVYPLLQYLILGPVITYYAKILWVYVGHRAGKKMGP